VNQTALTKQVKCGVKLIKTSNGSFLETTGLNIVINMPESVVKVMSSNTGDNLMQLCSEQSNLYHSQNAQKWEVSPKTLKWCNITPEEMRNLLRLIKVNLQLATVHCWRAIHRPGPQGYTATLA
jgi:hypothetical protein